MAEAGSTDRSVTRRTFLTTSGALSVGAAFAGAAAWPAAGDPGVDTWAHSYCDSGPGGELWDAVKDAQPGDKHLALVDFPTPNKTRPYGYAIKTGAKGAWDWLCIPLDRVSGIECEKCWEGSMLNLWPYAAAWVKDPSSKLGSDWALGINSGDPQARTQNQMHIHVTRLQQHVRAQITDAEKKKVPVAESFTDWPNKTIELRVSTDPSKPSRLFRWVHVKTLDVQPFIETFRYIAKHNGAEMRHQCLALFPAGNGGGYYILNSQEQLNTGGHHPFGIKTIDGLLYRG
jgi:hypothetical protein